MPDGGLWLSASLGTDVSAYKMMRLSMTEFSHIAAAMRPVVNGLKLDRSFEQRGDGKATRSSGAVSCVSSRALTWSKLWDRPFAAAMLVVDYEP